MENTLIQYGQQHAVRTVLIGDFIEINLYPRK